MAEQVTDQIVSRKPKDDAFRQQRMISWQPIMTPIKVVLIFLAVGVAFIPTGTTTFIIIIIITLLILLLLLSPPLLLPQQQHQQQQQLLLHILLT